MTEILQNNWGILASSPIILAIAAILQKVCFSRDFRQFLTKTLVNTYRHVIGKQVLAHPIFECYKSYIDTAEDIEFKGKVKTEAFKIVVKIKILTTIESLKQWIKKNRKIFPKWSRLELKSSIKELRENNFELFEERLKNKFTQKFGFEISTDLYEIIYLKNFKPDNEEKSEYLIDLFLDNIFKYEKVTGIGLVNKFLDRVDTSLNTTVDTLYKLYKKLNGSLLKFDEDF